VTRAGALDFASKDQSRKVGVRDSSPRPTWKKSSASYLHAPLLQ
jgi:hypothetical protein